MYLTPERQAFLQRCTVEQALDPLQVPEITSHMIRMDAGEKQQVEVPSEFDYIFGKTPKL